MTNHVEVGQIYRSRNQEGKGTYVVIRVRQGTTTSDDIQTLITIRRLDTRYTRMYNLGLFLSLYKPVNNTPPIKLPDNLFEI